MEQEIQVKFFALVALCLIASEVIADGASSGSDGGPHPPANWKPSGHVLLLPARQQTAQFYGPPPAEFAPRQVAPVEEEDEEEDDVSEIPTTDYYPSTTPQTDESNDGSSFNSGFISQPLQQQPQVTSGVYHVLLPDGRLQRVEYTTAPLKQAAYTSNSYSSQENKQFTQQNLDQTASSQNSRSGQGSGQFSFQKPSFQSNQFALNSFKQNQFQENNLGQSSQVPTNGQYRIPSNSQYFGYYHQGQQQNEEPKSFTPYPNSSSNQGSNKTTHGKPSGHSGSAQGKPSGHSGTTQGKTSVHSGSSQAKPSVGGQSQYKPSVPSVQTGASYTNPQPLYPSYTYQPIEFARQQEASDSPSSQFVFNGYLASVEYPNQQPAAVPSPVYSYSSAPLVRILRKTD